MKMKFSPWLILFLLTLSTSFQGSAGDLNDLPADEVFTRLQARFNARELNKTKFLYQIFVCCML